MILVCPEHPFVPKNKTSKLEARFVRVLENIAFDKLHREISHTIQSVGYKHFQQHDLRKTAFETAIDCESLMNNCTKGVETFECCKYFKPVYSEHGFCFASNTLYYDNAESE